MRTFQISKHRTFLDFGEDAKGTFTNTRTVQEAGSVAVEGKNG